MTTDELLTLIWEQSHSPWVFAPAKQSIMPAANYPAWHPGKAMERAEALAFLEAMHDMYGYDLYFTPLSFTAEQRKETTVTAQASVLFADMDGASWTRDPLPSFVWQTSPGSTQAVWLLDRKIPMPEWRWLSQAMTYFMGADRGGWFGSKVLRVPNTLNWKRAQVDGNSLTVPRGIILMENGDVHEVDKLVYLMREHAPVTGEGSHKEWGEHPEVTKVDPVRVGIRKSTWWLLNNPSGNDRSVAVWKAAVSCAKDGISKEDAFNLIWQSPVNKYRVSGRKNRLWADVNRAFDSLKA